MLDDEIIIEGNVGREREELSPSLFHFYRRHIISHFDRPSLQKSAAHLL